MRGAQDHAGMIIKSFYVYSHHPGLLIAMLKAVLSKAESKQSVSHLDMTFVRVTC